MSRIMLVVVPHERFLYIMIALEQLLYPNVSSFLQTFCIINVMSEAVFFAFALIFLDVTV